MERWQVGRGEGKGNDCQRLISWYGRGREHGGRWPRGRTEEGIYRGGGLTFLLMIVLQSVGASLNQCSGVSILQVREKAGRKDASVEAPGGASTGTGFGETRAGQDRPDIVGTRHKNRERHDELQLSDVARQNTRAKVEIGKAECAAV
ncbi:hypothetical protein C8T65DRAFT_60668 [Cerioporus squamosus]|nr:hypothetical protein C8T65DRAFT_60668 [Cerioporus squamosus]